MLPKTVSDSGVAALAVAGVDAVAGSAFCASAAGVQAQLARAKVDSAALATARRLSGGCSTDAACIERWGENREGMVSFVNRSVETSVMGREHALSGAAFSRLGCAHVTGPFRRKHATRAYTERR